MGNKIKQRYYCCKELRLSVAIIILWSLLVTMVFSYFAGLLGEAIGHGPLFFTILAVGYVLIIVVLTLIFAHRLIGPFQRLKTEIKLIRSGNYCKRLNIRDNDDMYLRTFIEEVNSMLNDLDNVQECKASLAEHIESELAFLLAEIEKKNLSGEELQASIISFKEKAKSILEKDQK